MAEDSLIIYFLWNWGQLCSRHFRWRTKLQLGKSYLKALSGSMTCSRKLVNGLIFTLIYVNAVFVFSTRIKQQEGLYCRSFKYYVLYCLKKETAIVNLAKEDSEFIARRSMLRDGLCYYTKTIRKGVRNSGRVVHPELKAVVGVDCARRMQLQWQNRKTPTKHNASAVIIYNDRGKRWTYEHEEWSGKIISYLLAWLKSWAKSLHAKIQKRNGVLLR